MGQLEGNWGRQVLEEFCATIKGVILCIFFKSIGVRDSNEAEVLIILEALRIFSPSFQDRLIVESDFSISIFWVTKLAVKP